MRRIIPMSDATILTHLAEFGEPGDSEQQHMIDDLCKDDLAKAVGRILMDPGNKDFSVGQHVFDADELLLIAYSYLLRHRKENRMQLVALRLAEIASSTACPAH